MKILTTVKSYIKETFKEQPFDQNQWEAQNAKSKRDYFSKEAERERQVLTSIAGLMLR